MPDNRMRHLKADLLKALGQPTRLKILELLLDGERCVCEIFPAINEAQSNISKHLAFLRSQGILVADRRGMRVFYRLADKRIVKLLNEAEECARSLMKARIDLVA